MSDPYGIIEIYRKGGSIMASFLEDVNQMVIDAVYQDIAEQLLEDWINSNLDEGQYYADKQSNKNCDEGPEYAEYEFMAYASPELKQQYNEFYGYTEKDEYYLC
jgi:hypothetical protein